MRGQRGVPEFVNIFHGFYFAPTCRRYLYIGNARHKARRLFAVALNAVDM
jgi:hypothetical protein